MRNFDKYGMIEYIIVEQKLSRIGKGIESARASLARATLIGLQQCTKK